MKKSILLLSTLFLIGCGEGKKEEAKEDAQPQEEVIVEGEVQEEAAPEAKEEETAPANEHEEESETETHEEDSSSDE